MRGSFLVALGVATVASASAQKKFWIHTPGDEYYINNYGDPRSVITQYLIDETDSISFVRPNALKFYDQFFVEGDYRSVSAFKEMDEEMLAEFLVDEEHVEKYVNFIHGPYAWNEYDDKFSWCVGEAMSGNLYHIYGDEGQFYFLNYASNNANIFNGYSSLYGVIARCNQIINCFQAACEKNNISQSVIDRAIGEAYMYRGMCYFLLTEYWGAVPLCLSSDFSKWGIHNYLGSGYPTLKERATRGTIYAQIEKDWIRAYELLPEERWGTNGMRATKYAAAGMLAKLYVTMASCQTELFKPEAYLCPDSDLYYKNAINWASKVLDKAGYLEEGYENYDKMFWPGSTSEEILFALCFEDGPYAAGSSRQVQFARSEALGTNNYAYGGEKGLTTTLFNSYENGDIRKKATSYFSDMSDSQTLKNMENGVGEYYELADGTRYYYFLNPNESLSNSERVYGKESLSDVLNHCRKFVYSVTPKNNAFSLPLTIPLLRVADVYLLRAEAKMGLATKSVSEATDAGIEDINVVRKRAGLKGIDECAFCVDDVVMKNMCSAVSMSGKEVFCDGYYATYDLMLERRHEFALECQNWLDIKRLYYRNPSVALYYMESMDRGFVYNQYGYSAQSRNDFMRRKLLKMVAQLDGEYFYRDEPMINYSDFNFTLPLPSNVSEWIEGIVDYEKEVKKGEYPY